MTPPLLPVRLLAQDPFGGQPDHVERADQVDVDDLLERLQRERPVLGHGLDRVADAGTVHRDPQRAQRLRRVQRRGDVLLAGDVGSGEHHPLPQLRGHRLTVRRRQVDDHGAAARGH